MRTTSIALGIAAALALPATALAAAPADKRNASKECKAERGTTPATQEAFRVKYGTNASGKNAFGKCVAQKTREEAAERKAARTNAAKLCKAERAQDPTAFKDKYGTKKNKRNAHGKCVSKTARTLKTEADANDKQAAGQVKNAAKECDTERGTTAESRKAFAEKYGTNKNDKNAFGKCVSAKARAS